MIARNPPPGPASDAYRTVWRWHFYAGLLVLPILMLMALTGGIYLFRAEIEDAVYRPMNAVSATATPVSADRWAASARSAGEGEIASVLMPERPHRAVRFTIRRPDQSQAFVFVDPADARVTGVTQAGGITETIKRIHSLEIVGRWGNLLVEVVAGWAMILVATGIFLWWPRRREAGVVAIKARSGRPFWRDLHAVTGLYTGAVIFFLAFTGMPWSGVWGEAILGQMRASDLGRPIAPPAASPWEHVEHKADAPQGVGWTMEGVGLSTPMHHAAPSLERVIQTATTADLARPWLISVPASSDLAWTVARQPAQVEDTRTLYIDGVSGQTRADIRYGEFGWGAKAFEWGIATHQGTQYGQINRFVMLGGCIAVWLLGISAIVMWWKRRPKGRLAAPPGPPGPRAKTAVLAIVLPLAILYPLTGLSLIVAVGLDRLVWLLSRPRPTAS
ncbi:MAG: PepSY domain-containing protein [Alphaproteobacteria bacterium]|nr:PepSY domain-containing protein [Alphaproteobacteria bacterium]MBU2380379.1 PepSY domain-containing protein [Alphaproteobacteria bacterium]